ncbi:MAG: DEAD/DEAH box helicase [Chloroflexota bacterium]
MTLASLLARWQADPDTAPNFAAHRILPPRPAELTPLPPLPDPLPAALTKRGIHALYSHQSAAFEAARRGKHVVLATGTASGKTLAYNLPVLSALIEDPSARALYLFPTKALTQDQLANLATFQPVSLQPAIYDGDTPQAKRPQIRKNARIVFTNPDMLHTGILPHHTNWGDFLRGLRFVVVDEMHTYRGVFGSHVANVIRRLKRVAAFYGARPQFLLTSATIGNPAELAERLIEEPVTLIDRDGSARGERHFILYNPPVVDPALGLRKFSFEESLRLAGELLEENVQSVVFARSRRSVEILLTQLQSERKDERRKTEHHDIFPLSSFIRGYRSGYLPQQRREIEKGLRDGSVRMVVATNALELGIDIGGLGAALLVGYPGGIASAWQQAGRAGRGEEAALAVLVAGAGPLDQFLAHHPDYFFGRSPEQGLVNPNHLLILLEHLRCAAFELPFQPGEGFGRLPSETVREFLDILTSNGELHQSNEKYFWMADAYPAANISLRSASPANVLLQTDEDGQPRILGEVDLASAPWMVHPRAVYLHEGQQYYVQGLDLTRNLAALIPVGLDYYTEPLRETSVSVLSSSAQAAVPGGEKEWGELQVTTQVTGFRKRSWLSGENLGEEPLDLPASDLQTTGYWLSLSEATLARLRESGAWTNDPNDYGPDWPKIRERVRARDGYRCQVCGLFEDGRQHDVHHKIPFRQFPSAEQANRLDNLATLCPNCHRKAEQNVRMRSGLAGLAYVLGNLAPLFLMCDPRDLGSHIEPVSSSSFPNPSVVLYDVVPAGIGFSQKLFEMHDDLLARAIELVTECPCEGGCPSCVGPAGENGVGGKRETVEILTELISSF